jgi:putative PIN family toxin of toxin-antitoxin system
VFRAVLDANVYVSAFVRPEGPPGHIVERLLQDQAFEVVLSTAIVDEVPQALAYPKVRKGRPHEGRAGSLVRGHRRPG